MSSSILILQKLIKIEANSHNESPNLKKRGKIRSFKKARENSNFLKARENSNVQTASTDKYN